MPSPEGDGQTGAMRWEYRTLHAEREGARMYPAFITELGRLGDQGWEVVAALPIGSASGSGTLILKRPKEAP